MPEYSNAEAKWHVDVISWFKGGIIGTAEVALKFAEIVLEHTQGKAELAKQQPLLVRNQGDTWRIEGSWNPDAGEMELAHGPWRMVVKKHDAQILDIGSAAVVKLSPEVGRRVEEATRLARTLDERRQVKE